jgi:hypothetical protein
MGADPLGYLQLLWRATVFGKKQKGKSESKHKNPCYNQQRSGTDRVRQEGTGHDGGGSDAYTPPNDLPIQQPRAPIFCRSNPGARHGCRKRRCDRDKPREAQQTEQRGGYRAASLSEEAAEKSNDCTSQKSSQMLPGQSVFSPLVLSKGFHTDMGA